MCAILVAMEACGAGTRLLGPEITRQLGIDRQTLAAWAPAGGWLRPDGAPLRFGGPGRNHGMRARLARQREAKRRLDETERMMGEGDEIAAAFGLPRGATRIAGARVVRTTEVGRLGRRSVHRRPGGWCGGGERA